MLIIYLLLLASVLWLTCPHCCLCSCLCGSLGVTGFPAISGVVVAGVPAAADILLVSGVAAAADIPVVVGVPLVADVSVDAGVPASVGALLILGYPAVGSFFIIA